MKRKGEINLEYSKRVLRTGSVIFKGASCLTFLISVLDSSTTFFFFFFGFFSSSVFCSIF